MSSQAATRRAWLAAAMTSGGLFLAVVSTTAVSVALPTIGRDMHASAIDLQWVVDAYVLVYASLLVGGGVIGDRYGRKGVFLLGIAIFGLGSLLAGIAPSVGVLLAGRVLQGVGPALLVPASLTIIRAAFEDQRPRAAAIGLWSMSAGLALAVGPVLGGLVVDALGWRWIFLLNVPLSAVLILLAALLIRRLPRMPAQGRFDWLGAFLTTVSLGLLVFAVIEGQARGWESPLVIATFAVGVVMFAGFIAWEGRVAQPLVDVSLFRRPAFTAANLAAFVVFFAFVGVIVYFSAYFQQVQGHSPLEAGLDVSAIGVALAISSVLTGPLVARVGEFWPMFAGLILSGAATLGLLRLRPGTGVGSIWWDFALIGIGIGLCGTATTTVAMSVVDVSQAGMASAVVNAVRQVGQVFGVAVLGALVYAHLPGGSAGQRLGPAASSLFVGGLHNALWVSGLGLLVVAPLALLVPRNAAKRRQLAGRAGPSQTSVNRLRTNEPAKRSR